MIYSLNTKNDDLEYDMEAMRVAYEDKLQKVGKEHAFNSNSGNTLIQIYKGHSKMPAQIQPENYARNGQVDEQSIQNLDLVPHICHYCQRIKKQVDICTHTDAASAALRPHQEPLLKIHLFIGDKLC